MEEIEKLDRKRKNIIKLSIIIIIAFLICACYGYNITENSYKPPHDNEYLFVEIWHNVHGKIITGNSSAIPKHCVDSPMYSYNLANKTLKDRLSHTLYYINYTKAIIGSGGTVTGDIGSGSASDLKPYFQFPIIVNSSLSINETEKFSYSIIIESYEKLVINQTIVLYEGQNYSFESNYTKQILDKNGEPATIFYHETERISNIGIWSKSKIIYQL